MAPLPFCSMAPRRRLVVVSYTANWPFTARGERTRRLVDALDAAWDVSLLAGPEPVVATRPSIRWAAAGLRGRLAGTVLLDAYEPWSRRRFRGWEPEADLALLVGWPFSPLVAAARCLAKRGIPYVVDAGDPFALTPGAIREVGGIAALRATRLEAEMWRGAAGAIVTTPPQAGALRERFPSLPLLVRPNGHRSPELPPDAFHPRPPVTRPELRLVYFGHFRERVHAECRWFFERLLESGLWPSIVLDQYSLDAIPEFPSCLPNGVRFRRCQALPWEEAIRVSRDYDLALVVGSRNGVLLPSKVIEYLTLPLPRLAVVESVEDDAISGYLAGRGGWLIVDDRHGDPLPDVARHARSELPAEDLAPPPEEAWPRVTEAIASFLDAVLAAGPRSAPLLGPDPPAPASQAP